MPKRVYKKKTQTTKKLTTTDILVKAYKAKCSAEGIQVSCTKCGTVFAPNGVRIRAQLQKLAEDKKCPFLCKTCLEVV